jgi:hypothetical protein
MLKPVKRFANWIKPFTVLDLILIPLAVLILVKG